MKSPKITAEDLLANLHTVPESGPYYVAYSGGLDSHVLLHLLSTVRSDLPHTIHALHVNHGISKKANLWAIHCKNICDALGIDFSSLKIDGVCPSGESLEAWARNARYRIMKNAMQEGATLLTAHHQDDQAETLLLQMIRGAGVNGLAAMGRFTNRDGYCHSRPLLGKSRRSLLDYAKVNKLEWIEDESNSNISYDRNFLRQTIFPLLKERWPGINKTLTRVSAHQADAKLLLEELAEIDLKNCVDESGFTIAVDQLKLLSMARQANVIRYWLIRRELPVPDTRRMKQILNELLNARQDATPVVLWSGCEIRRFQQRLYASNSLPAYDTNSVIKWKLDRPCLLVDSRLVANLGQGVGIKTSLCPQRILQVRYRQGGEKIRIKNKNHRQELKKLFQERGIPPWLRNRVPLLYSDDSLVAVADFWIDSAAQSEENETSWQIQWIDSEEINKTNRSKDGS